MQQLTIHNEDLNVTVETLKAELISSNEEAERASRELEAMRSRALQENAQEVFIRERELREVQGELEQVRMERDEWERKALQEHIAADEAKSMVDTLGRDLEIEREAREREAVALQTEQEKVNNLQSVLEDFQAGKYLWGCGDIHSPCSSKGPRTTGSGQGLRVAISTGYAIIS